MADNEKVVRFQSTKARRAETRRLNPARLRDARIAKRLNQSELAHLVGVTRQAISAFEQGEKSPDASTMTGIAAALEQPLSYFTTEAPPLFGESSARFFRAVGPKTKRRNLACEVLGKWLVQTAKHLDGFVNYPMVNLSTFEPASGDGRYTPEEIESAADAVRRRWRLGYGPISNVVALLENNGVITCRYEITGERIDAFSFWNGDRPFLFLASDKDAACRSRFDVAHELGHLVLHRWVGQEELEDPKVLKEVIEPEANRFAGAFLAPAQSFPAEVYTTRLDAFVALKRRWRLAVQAMVYRCKDLGVFDEYQVTNLYKQISARRWRTREPLDDTDEIPLEQPRMLNRAAHLVLEGGATETEDICRALGISRQDIEQLCNLTPGTLADRPPEDFVPTLK